MEKRIRGPACSSSLSNHKCGVAILCTNDKNKIKATYEYSCKAGRAPFKKKIEMEWLSYKRRNIYAPNIPRKRKKNQKLEIYIQNSTNNILEGDFNMVEDIPIDRGGRNPTWVVRHGIEYINNIKNNTI